VSLPPALAKKEAADLVISTLPKQRILGFFFGRGVISQRNVRKYGSVIRKIWRDVAKRWAMADLVWPNSWAHRNQNEDWGKKIEQRQTKKSQPNKQNKCAIKEVDRIEPSI